MYSILEKIVTTKIKRIKEEGFDFGISVPQKRLSTSAQPDFSEGCLICEIKRASPSRGMMNDIADPMKLAGHYIEGGADAISVLTEEDYFKGSLNDLMKIKTGYPEMPVLRKDFIIYPEEVEVTYRAGADMMLIITALFMEDTFPFTFENMQNIYNECLSYGLLPLIEVHDRAEYEVAQKLAPSLIGINSRNLNTFTINRAYPLALHSVMNDGVKVIFESGIRGAQDAEYIGKAGLDGMLVGTGIVTSSEITQTVRAVKEGYVKGLKSPDKTLSSISRKMCLETSPALKICGITSTEDAKAAVASGADMLGFVFAESPRQVNTEKVRAIVNSLPESVIKVAVVTDKGIEEAVAGVREGIIDVVQFHGNTDSEECASYGVPWFKAVRVREFADFIGDYQCPFLLYDAFSPQREGGTGKRIDETLLLQAKEKGIPLALAGGLDPQNIGPIIEKFQPLLVDVSSGVEEYPGKKDKRKMELFAKIVKKYDI